MQTLNSKLKIICRKLEEQKKNVLYFHLETNEMRNFDRDIPWSTSRRPTLKLFYKTPARKCLLCRQNNYDRYFDRFIPRPHWTSSVLDPRLPIRSPGHLVHATIYAQGNSNTHGIAQSDKDHAVSRADQQSQQPANTRVFMMLRQLSVKPANTRVGMMLARETRGSILLSIIN